MDKLPEEPVGKIEREAANGFEIDIITDAQKLLDLETRRVLFYLSEYPKYKEKGYAKILRFPSSIQPETDHGIGADHLREVIQREMQQNESHYTNFGRIFEKARQDISRCIPVAETLLGYKVAGKYAVAPTSYGTVGSPQEPIFFRLPELRPNTIGQGFTTGRYRTPLEMLIHEIVAHKATADIREGTSISDSIDCTHQKHKEHLMDLLGRTILVRSGLMSRENVAMQIDPQNVASGDITPLYYGQRQSEDLLPWQGDARKLISDIDNHLRAV